MGYYTYYKNINIAIPKSLFGSMSTNEVSEYVVNKFREVTDCHFESVSVDFFEDNCEVWLELEESCKWYDHAKDLVTLSLHFPNSTISLDGEGEENGDIWGAYCRNGKFIKSQAVLSFWTNDKEVKEKDNILKSIVKPNINIEKIFQTQKDTEVKQVVDEKQAKIEALEQEIKSLKEST